MVAGQCCRARGRERPSLLAGDVSSLCHLSRVHAGVRNKGTSRALHERQKCVRWRRRLATRTMHRATPGVKPPPRSDATATRYAPYTRCYERAREHCFRSGYARSWRSYRAGNLARESSRHALKPCLPSSRCECVYCITYILFILCRKRLIESDKSRKW